MLPFLANAQNKALADSLVKVYHNDPEDSVINEILYGISMYHTNQDSTIYYGNLLIKHASVDSQFFFLFQAYLNIGHAYKRKGELEQALTSYFLAEKNARAEDGLSRTGAIYVAIGDIYADSNNRTTAVLYYNRAIELLRTPNDSVTLAIALMNAGTVYYDNDILDSALLYFRESGEIFRLRGYEIGSAYTLANIGELYAKQGKNELATETINKGIKLLEKFGDNFAIASLYVSMADIYIEKGEFSKALVYAINCLQIGEEGGYKELIRDANLKLSEVYGLSEDYENAYKHQTQYLVYRDSINNTETTQKLADLRTEYEVSLKQNEVDILEQEKHTQAIIGYAMAAVLLLIILLAIFIYRTSMQRKLVNAQLARQKSTLESQRDQLEGLNNTKDRFFSIISHDLRGPVNAFTGVGELIRNLINESAYDELVETTDQIDQSTTELSSLLDNLLNWAVTQQGEFPYNPEQINLADIGAELQGVFKNMSTAKDIALIIDLAPEVSVWADKNSTRTILRNLVNNALKFTEKGGKITLSAKHEGQQTLITVSDNGIGISKDRLASLFQLQDKKRTWGTEGEKGLGLGLQLAQEFAAMNKGSISVSSEVNIGTTFTVKLPKYKQ